MAIDKAIFKAYDIRGVYPSQIDEGGIYDLGQAFVKHLKVKEVAVGHDMRVSTPKLLPHLIAGINDAGAKVVDIGFIGTEVMYFAVGKFKLESGIMLTASHNPPEYTGLKMVKKDSIPLDEETIKVIGEIAIKGLRSKKRGWVAPNIVKLDPFPGYKKAIYSMVEVEDLEPLKVIVDAGNGMGGVLIDKVFSNSPIKITKMYFEPNGNFPNHIADPLKEENTLELRKRVVEEKADLGIALDGDGDRCFFIDRYGKYSLGYYIVALLAERMLKKYPGAKIVHENRLLWAIEDRVKQAGGIPVVSKAGYAIMRPLMRKIESVFGGETSSHFFYKNLYYADSSMATIALMLEIISESGKTLDQILEPFREKYFLSGEINYEVSNANITLKKIKEFYQLKGYKIDELDGIAVEDGRNWRFSLRKSNTEPLIRLNVEAKSQDIVDNKVSEILKLIKNHGGIS